MRNEFLAVLMIGSLGLASCSTNTPAPRSPASEGGFFSFMKEKKAIVPAFKMKVMNYSGEPLAITLQYKCVHYSAKLPNLLTISRPSDIIYNSGYTGTGCGVREHKIMIPEDGEIVVPEMDMVNNRFKQDYGFSFYISHADSKIQLNDPQPRHDYHAEYLASTGRYFKIEELEKAIATNKEMTYSIYKIPKITKAMIDQKYKVERPVITDHHGTKIDVAADDRLISKLGSITYKIGNEFESALNYIYFDYKPQDFFRLLDSDHGANPTVSLKVNYAYTRYVDAQTYNDAGYKLRERLRYGMEGKKSVYFEDLGLDKVVDESFTYSELRSKFD